MRTAASIAVYAIGASLTLLALVMWRKAMIQRRTSLEPLMGAAGALLSIGISLMIIGAVLVRES